MVFRPRPAGTAWDFGRQSCGQLRPAAELENFAQPLNSNGFIRGTAPFTGSAGLGLLVDFDFGIPASKVVGTGEYIVIGTTPSGPLYLQLIEPDPNFPAFQNCPRLSG